MKKGFTLIEVMVVLVIAIVIISAAVTVFKGSTTDFAEDDMWWVSPEIQNMKSQRKIADELQRQNDLRERELDLRQQLER